MTYHSHSSIPRSAAQTSGDRDADDKSPLKGLFTTQCCYKRDVRPDKNGNEDMICDRHFHI